MLHNKRNQIIAQTIVIVDQEMLIAIAVNDAVITINVVLIIVAATVLINVAMNNVHQVVKEDQTIAEVHAIVIAILVIDRNRNGMLVINLPHKTKHNRNGIQLINLLHPSKRLRNGMLVINLLHRTKRSKNGVLPTNLLHKTKRHKILSSQMLAPHKIR